MTRIPDLEAELLAAAERRYGRAAARRRVPSLAWLRPRLLLPVAAAVLAAVAVQSTLRSQDPEVEVPAAQFAPSARPGVDELLRRPLSRAIGTTIDRRVQPVTMVAGEAAKAKWKLAVYGGRGGQVCVAAVPTRRGSGRGGSTSCSPGASVVVAADRREPALSGVSMGDGRLVFGVVAEDARQLRVGDRRGDRLAELSDQVFTRALTPAERRALPADVRSRLRTIRLRLYAAVFSPREIRSGLPLTVHERRATYADGETRSLGAP